jgi:hypothetical protein
MMPRLWWWRNSIGSSTVTMCDARLAFALSMIAARVVDFPTRSGRNEHETAREMREVDELRREPSWATDLISVGMMRRRSEAALVLEDVDAEPGDVAHRVRQVEFEIPLERRQHLGGDEPLDHATDTLAAPLRRPADRSEFAVDTHDGCRLRDDVEVGCPLRQHRGDGRDELGVDVGIWARSAGSTSPARAARPLAVSVVAAPRPARCPRRAVGAADT